MEREGGEGLQKSLYCIIEGHEENLMNMVCIDTQCHTRGLICIECMDESHSGHRTKTFKKFLLDLKGLDALSIPSQSQINNEEGDNIESDIEQNMEFIQVCGNELIQKLTSFLESMKTNLIGFAEQISKREQKMHDSLVFETPTKIFEHLKENMSEKNINNEMAKALISDIKKLCNCISGFKEDNYTLQFSEQLTQSKKKLDEYSEFLKNVRSLIFKRLRFVEPYLQEIFSLDSMMEQLRTPHRSVTTQTDHVELQQPEIINPSQANQNKVIITLA